MPDCKMCKENRQRVDDVPYIVHEGEVARLERMIKRFFVVALVLILLFVATNAYWIYYVNQFEDITVTQELDGELDRVAISGAGDVIYGESEADSQDTQAQDGR